MVEDEDQTKEEAGAAKILEELTKNKMPDTNKDISQLLEKDSGIGKAEL